MTGVDDFDVVVVGGGAGGMSAAREAVRRGARALLVQQGPIGGDCTFTGCVPSKAMIAAAARGEDFADAMAHVHRAVERVAASEDDAVMAREGIEVRHRWATLRSPTEVDLEGTRVRAKAVIVATGARPAIPPVPGLAEAAPLTNETVFELRSRPARLAVIGGGPIGCELAQAFARLGTAVTVVEAGDRILAKEEPEAGEVVAQALRDDGVRLVVGARLDRVEPAGRAHRLIVGDDEIEVDAILVAAGRTPSTKGMGLEDVGVRLDDRGFVETDDTMATSVPGIWAVGDVAGKLQFTHAASRMGFIAARNALSRWAKVRKQHFEAGSIPWTTFTSPEVGRVGMTEAEAAEHGGRVAYLPMTEVDRAIATGETRGYLKLVAGPRRVLGNTGGGRLLGATAVASCGGELVHEVALAMRTAMFTGRLVQTVHAYPTWSMAVQKAAVQFFFEVEGREARPAQA